MNRSGVKALATLLLAGVLASKSAVAVVYFEEGFETPFPGTYPEWTLPPVIDNNVGPGNFFERTDVTCHTGNYSLRFDHNAQNGFCNTCGAKVIQHSNDPQHEGVQYFVAKNGEDVTEPDDGTLEGKGPGASVGKLVYNKSAGFSQWQITAITNENAINDRVELMLLKHGIGGETTDFNGNDDVAFIRECGVDGNIGKVSGEFTISRRSDCNNVIMWFQQIPEGVQAPGESIWRRVYVKAELTSPPTHQKIRYWQTQPTTLQPFGSQIIIFADPVNGKQELNISGFGQIGGAGLYKPGLNGLPADVAMERGVWYYIEEEFKPESSEGQGNGIYRLWFDKASDADISDLPVLELTGLNLPPIEGGDKNNTSGNPNHASFWGNTQHESHTVGKWYIDDMEIRNGTRIGPIPPDPGCANTATPKPPSN